MSARLIRAYLDRYAEPIVAVFDRDVLHQLSRTYPAVVVVPAYDEPLDCLERLLGMKNWAVLAIVVVNAAVDCDRSAITRTQTLLDHLRPGNESIALVPWSAETTLLVVDCCSEGRQLPKQQGVGLARKIGADLALACITAGVVAAPWICCTDADVVLPEDYFDDYFDDCDRIPNSSPSPMKPGPAAVAETAVREPEGNERKKGNEDVAVVLYPFSHHPLHNNILCYEIFLRYYVIQLAAAGSPYAFQTIGSLFKIHASHYAAVRGFPKRKAAEDFYMLNKLAKTGKVMRLSAPTLLLSSRISKRVPFGTGAAMQRLATDPELRFYNPEIFARLRGWLETIDCLWQQRAAVQQMGLQQWWRQSDLENDVALAALIRLGLEKTLHHAYRQCNNSDRFRFFLWVWFDAFRTLKFVHYLRDNGFPSVSLECAIAALPNLPKNLQFDGTEATLAQLQLIHQYLTHQESLLPPETGPTIGTVLQKG